MGLVRERAGSARFAVEERLWAVWDPAQLRWSRGWLVREQARDEMRAGRLAIAPAPAAPEGITVEVELWESGPKRRAGFTVLASAGRLCIGSSESDGVALTVPPGWWAVELLRLGGGQHRARISPSLGPAMVVDPGELAPFRSQAMQRILDGASAAQAADQHRFDGQVAGHDRYQLDRDRGVMLLLAAGQVAHRVRFHAIGTLGDGGTFRWAWANPTLLPTVSARAQRVRELGVARDLPWLTTPEIDLPLGDVRQLMSLATRAMGFSALYPAPYERGVLYVAVEGEAPFT